MTTRKMRALAILPSAKVRSMTAKQFVEALTDPDTIGQSEYRVLHELLTSIVDSGGANLDLLETSLDEVQEWVKTLRSYIQRAKEGRKPLAPAK
jgi:hypothetical protein